jgi:hypothetical protein
MLIDAGTWQLKNESDPKNIGFGKQGMMASFE